VANYETITIAVYLNGLTTLSDTLSVVISEQTFATDMALVGPAASLSSVIPLILALG
jgi:hypothetical protein